MNQITLHIDGEIVATISVEKSNISTDYQIVDISNAEKKSNTSQVFNLPATDKLRQVLGFPENFNSIDAVSHTKKVVGELKENGETIISGIINFKGSIIDGHKTYYQLSIVGDNAIWASELSDKQLRHLDLYDYTHAWSKAVQNASEFISAIPYVYPLIDNGFGRILVHEAAFGGANSVQLLVRGEIFTSDFNGQDVELSGFDSNEYNKVFVDGSYTVQDLYDGVNSRLTLLNTVFQPFDFVPEVGYIKIQKTTGIRIRVTDRYPMIRESFLIEKMFNEIGYTVASSYLTQTLSRIFTVHEANKGFEGQKRFNDFTAFKVGIIEDVVFAASPGTFTDHVFPFDDVTFGTHFDNGNFFDLDDFHYKPRIATRQDFDFAFAFQVSGSVTLSVWVETDTQYLKIVTNQTFTTGTHTLKSTLSTFQNVSETDAVRVRVQVKNSTNQIVFKKGNCFFWNEIRFQPRTEGDNIYLVEHLPSVSQLKYFEAVVKRNGLMVMTDTNTKTVYIEPQDDFIDKSNIVAWTHKTDFSKPIESEAILSNSPAGVLYKYKNDSKDTALNTLLDIYNIEYGSFKYAYKSVFKGTEYDEYQNELFSATFERPAANIGFPSHNIPVIAMPKYGDLHQTRVLFYNGTSGLSGETWLQGGTVRTNAPIPYFIKDTISNNRSLHYEDGVNTTGLAKRNFGTLHKEIDDSIYFSIYLSLNAFDIAQFINIDDDLKKDFRAVFKIYTLKGTYLCRLVKIENYQTHANGATKCFFIKLVDTHFDTNDQEIPADQEVQAVGN